MKHRIFLKGDTVHALLASYNNPNILIPVKAKVKDIKLDDVNPLYQLKIIKFYDHIKFIEKYLFGMNFSNQFARRAKPLFNFNKKQFESTDELEREISENNEKNYYVVVDSIMVTKHLLEMKNLFSKIQTYLIVSKLRESAELSARPFYNGCLKMNSKEDFRKRFIIAFNDTIEKRGEDPERIARML